VIELLKEIFVERNAGPAEWGHGFSPSEIVPSFEVVRSERIVLTVRWERCAKREMQRREPIGRWRLAHRVFGASKGMSYA
jgi:hypothetical protein